MVYCENAGFYKKNIQTSFYFTNDECVTYCGLSGDIHLIEGSNARFLNILSMQPMSYLEIVSYFADEYDCEIDPNLHDHVKSMIDHYQKLNLLEVIGSKNS